VDETRFGCSEFRFQRRFNAFQRILQPPALQWSWYHDALRPTNPKEEVGGGSVYCFE
jgi:hypothetical protein